MKKFGRLAALFALTLVLALAWVPAQPAQGAPSDQACWGQATRVFAATGEMGAHSSSQGNPRLGLRNLARALYADGVIPDDTMQALGAFVAAELDLSIDACM